MMLATLCTLADTPTGQQVGFDGASSAHSYNIGVKAKRPASIGLNWTRTPMAASMSGLSELRLALYNRNAESRDGRCLTRVAQPLYIHLHITKAGGTTWRMYSYRHFFKQSQLCSIAGCCTSGQRISEGLKGAWDCLCDFVSYEMSIDVMHAISPQHRLVRAITFVREPWDYLVSGINHYACKHGPPCKATAAEWFHLWSAGEFVRNVCVDPPTSWLALGSMQTAFLQGGVGGAKPCDAGHTIVPNAARAVATLHTLFFVGVVDKMGEAACVFSKMSGLGDTELLCLRDHEGNATRRRPMLHGGTNASSLIRDSVMAMVGPNRHTLQTSIDQYDGLLYSTAREIFSRLQNA
mmetsp:Transcript_24426/g.77400  ORF Transcript_24426/g.77400 Transcript_24426/m.77400 type:complete len:351 (-) Transcript_24426:147-1199(-)